MAKRELHSVKKKRRVGNPNLTVKYTPEVVNKIKDKLDIYINETEMPTLTEFCLLNDLYIELFSSDAILTQAKKRLFLKKQDYLERNSLKNKVNVAQAIFSLKQLGWRDKQDVNSNITVNYEIQGIKKPATAGQSPESLSNAVDADDS